MSDLEILVKKAKRGDKNSFGELYKIYLKKIYRFIYYLVYDRQLAEDLTQLVFLKAYKSLPSFVPEKGTFQAYLYTVARNLVIDYQRRKKELSLEDVEEPVSTFDIDEEVVREESKDIVRNLLIGLESDERQLIIWRYFEELEFSEIAQILNEKEGAVRVRLHRLLKKLKERLKE